MLNHQSQQVLFFFMSETWDYFAAAWEHVAQYNLYNAEGLISQINQKSPNVYLLSTSDHLTWNPLAGWSVKDWKAIPVLSFIEYSSSISNTSWVSWLCSQIL